MNLEKKSIQQDHNKKSNDTIITSRLYIYLETLGFIKFSRYFKKNKINLYFVDIVKSQMKELYILNYAIAFAENERICKWKNKQTRKTNRIKSLQNKYVEFSKHRNADNYSVNEKNKRYSINNWFDKHKFTYRKISEEIKSVEITLLIHLQIMKEIKQMLGLMSYIIRFVVITGSISLN